VSFGNFRRGIHVGKKRHHFSWLFLLVIGLCVAGASAQEAKYPPLSEYIIARDAEIALAKSAAPDYVSDHATIKVLTASGFQTAHDGDNGYVCIVMRGFTGAPTYTPVQVRDYINYDSKTRAPICLDPLASRTILPYYELRTKLGLEGKTAEQIARGTSRLRQRRHPKAPRSVFCLHVVGGPSARTGGPLASTYNGLPSQLRDPARHQAPANPSSSHRGRRGNTVCRRDYPRGRQTGHKGAAIIESQNWFLESSGQSFLRRGFPCESS